MRALRIVVSGILSALIIVVLAIFAIENLQRVPARFFGNGFTPTLWWISIGSAVLGFVLALLVLEPGRIAARQSARSLSREHSWAEAEVDALRAERNGLRTERDQLRIRLSAAKDELRMLHMQYDHLQAEREDMRTERDQLRSRLTVAKEVASGAVPPTAGRTGAVAGTMEQPNQGAVGRVETKLEALQVAHRALRTQYTRLQAERKGVRTERDRLRARLATVNEVVSEGTPSVASSSTTPPSDQAAGAMRQSSAEHTDDARVEGPTAGAAKP